MRFFVTGVAGQLGHDVMNELFSRGYAGVGSDIAPEYSGVQDGSAVTKLPYASLDITDAEAVEQVLQQAKPDVVMATAKEVDFVASSIVCEYWHGPFSYELSTKEDKKVFPLSEEGKMQMKAWLEENI